MRVGILTVPFNNNYGGFLQAFALKKVILAMGHDVIFINRRRNLPQDYKSKIRRLFYKFHILKDKKKIRIQEISKYTDEFKRNYLEPITEAFYTSKQLKKILNYNIDMIVVGSDQVWRYRYAKDSIDDYFCSFLDGSNIPRISYAASMGTSKMEYPQDKLKICSSLLKNFNAISVREESTQKMLKEYFCYYDAKIVLDPTFLLEIRDYKKLFDSNKNKRLKPYVFSYILDSNEIMNHEIDKYANLNNLDILALTAQSNNLYDMNIIEPVEKWLASIYYSENVVTDSFHGTVFSIIFNKKFAVYINEMRGSARIESLLKLFGLTDKLVRPNNSLNKIFSVDIDWNRVNNIINQLRVDSIDFLRSNIDNAIKK